MIAGLQDRDTSAEPLREAACMSSKYALVERERRFVVPKLPPGEPWATRSITDLYIDGKQIRLRFSVGTVHGRPEILRKLTQKLPGRTDVVGHCGFITTMYLNEAEFEVLTRLPGYTLTKRRLSFPPMGVDVFSGALGGLIIAEAEFADDETMSAFVPPLWCGPEVTLVDELAGGNLARLASRPRAEVEEALASFDLAPDVLFAPGTTQPSPKGEHRRSSAMPCSVRSILRRQRCQIASPEHRS